MGQLLKAKGETRGIHLTVKITALVAPRVNYGGRPGASDLTGKM